MAAQPGSGQCRLADDDEDGRVIFNPPYTHQSQALEEVLANQSNLMIMTGTGSGKTESFLIPILAKFIHEATSNAESFRNFHAVRAMILYPMNALVNDQLGRLRLMFGNPKTVSMFEEWSGRPARFARYTSRTPYAGVRSPTKDSNRLSSIGDFFVEIEQAANRHDAGSPINENEDRSAFELREILKERGKWPAKPNISDWFGTPNSRWRNREGEYQRAVLGPHEAELLTRHEVHRTPPDLLITNYSMLEYMMLRPVERPIFDATRLWLENNPNEKFLIVLDEAHLYRGAQGTEVSLLLRRLRERLGVSEDRFQVICATASFSDEGRPLAAEFGSQLSGTLPESFVPVTGDLALRSPTATGSATDANMLASVDLEKFYSSSTELQNESLAHFLSYRNVESSDTIPVRLYRALENFAPFNLLVNDTMQSAIPLSELGGFIFPDIETAIADRAITALLALGSRARLSDDAPSLLPCRIHSFFRGLPGLWVCMDQECSELSESDRGSPAGKLYSQPRPRCECGAPVLEYFTCKLCGTSYARAYTNNIRNPHHLWAEPGERLVTEAGEYHAFEPLDLLLEEPVNPGLGMLAEYDLVSGLLNSGSNNRQRDVYLNPQTQDLATDDEDRERSTRPGEFSPCGCCQRRLNQTSIVQDHQTKGDQPFQAILTEQIKVQPPGTQAASEFAPLRGRKVLIFSDSRQVAARLAPAVQLYSLNDTVRALLPVGYQLLSQQPIFSGSLSLENAYLAVLIAAHRFGVRIRPELQSGESMPSISAPLGEIPQGPELIQLMSQTSRCPENLMHSIYSVLIDYSLGLEPLAVASISERGDLSSVIDSLPDLQGLANDSNSKRAVARVWLRCWLRRPGIWFGIMPPNWWMDKVTSHQGKFKPMSDFLDSRGAKRTFERDWLPNLMHTFANRMQDGGIRILASNLSLDIGGNWKRCNTCKSVHRPIENYNPCIDCLSEDTEEFDPNEDDYFKARKSFYRAPIIEALETDNPSIFSLIAAEHTAQLNAARPDDAFSQAENHEVRFQDISLAWRITDSREPAIDVLSSTTTMEVGIDIGQLSGVALRNMPPGRANYQQRAGRAGRRGTAFATVVAFGSSDSHDDHYFTSPDEMIRGAVVDPRLTLENPDITRRHVRAYLLQRYHEDRLPDIDPNANPNLFSVLGRVRDFRDGTGLLNRNDLLSWLHQNEEALRGRLSNWLPTQLRDEDRQQLLSGFVTDLIREIDAAIDFREDEPDEEQTETVDDSAEDDEDDATIEVDVDHPANNELADPSNENLLNRLLFWGILPRYAFPTDVAPFYVFNRELSTPYRQSIKFAPSQALHVALSQYAPNKQIWIKDRRYTSKAIYSPYGDDIGDAWANRRLYFECSHCKYAETVPYTDDMRNSIQQCPACRHQPDTYGPAKPWMRPPGFAHPIGREPETRPDNSLETAYATRAKLVMPTPPANEQWIPINDRARGYATREHLLVTNSGPDEEGYNYCVSCGRIESAAHPEVNLFQPHSWPYRRDDPPECPGMAASRITLGTSFQTDIALFSLPLSDPFKLRPGNDETETALRTACEALSIAASRILEIEPGEVLAEFRPALTNDGALGHEVEVFLYDTLAGGAGFATQLVPLAERLFHEALNILSNCPDTCEASCYRCLRSFRNRLDHRLLDRVIGEQFMRHVLYGAYPTYGANRIRTSMNLLISQLQSQLPGDFDLLQNEHRSLQGTPNFEIPLILRRRSNARETWVSLSSPLAPETPIAPDLQAAPRAILDQVVCVDDMLISRHLPQAIELVLRSLH